MATTKDGRPYQWPFMASAALMEQSMQISAEAWQALATWPRTPRKQSGFNITLYFEDCERRRAAGQAAIAQAVRTLLGIPDIPQS